MTAWLDDGDVQLYHGDALDQLRGLADASVQCVITSPPFWALRDYGVDGQIGLEATPGEWCARLVAVFRECRRVLRDDGVLWLEVGDTYTAGGHVDGRRAKDLVGAPWLLAFALRADGWYLRADVIWARPNPMPESTTDRPTKAHSYLFLLTKRGRYYFDAYAVREPDAGHPSGNGFTNRQGAAAHQARSGGDGTPESWTPGGGRNIRSVWTIATEATPFAHFATFPQTLVERCLKAATSEHGACPACGAPWQRDVDRVSTERYELPVGDPRHRPARYDATHAESPYAANGGMRYSTLTETGWSPTCNHAPIYPGPTVRPCVVLDPFMGSGTVALVARRLGRRAVGIELNAAYLAIAAKRLQQLSLFGGEPR